MTALNKIVVAYQLRKLFAEALMVTEAIYDLRESRNCARTFDTYFTYQIILPLYLIILPLMTTPQNVEQEH